MVDTDYVQGALDRYEASLIRYAMSLLGDLDRARDVVQETFLKLCRQDPDRIRSYLAQWLFRVCRNQALDLLRKEKRMAWEQVGDCEQMRASDVPSQGESLQQEEELTQIRNLLTHLSANQQEVIRLKFEGGLSYREISAVTGLTISNVGFLIHTGLKKVRAQLQDQATRQPRLRRVK
jgi:RNA polymerase sigma-70 factor (ECF subfamily)